MKKKRKNKIIKFVPRFNDIIFLIALYQLDFIPTLFERSPTHPIKVALSNFFLVVERAHCSPISPGS